MTVIFLAIFLFALLSAFVLTRYVRDYATARRWVAIPTTERHMHSTPLPRLGGVAIFISFSLSIGLAILLASHNSRLYSHFSHKTLLTILVPATLVFLLGVYDDIRGVGPYFKFAIQAVAATMLFIGGLRIVNIPVVFGSHSLPWFIGLPLTVLWRFAIMHSLYRLRRL